MRAAGFPIGFAGFQFTAWLITPLLYYSQPVPQLRKDSSDFSVCVPVGKDQTPRAGAEAFQYSQRLVQGRVQATGRGGVIIGTLTYRPQARASDVTKLTTLPPKNASEAAPEGRLCAGVSALDLKQAN
jgi:hypothetical protein